MEYKVVQGRYEITSFDEVMEQCKEFIKTTLAENDTKNARRIIRKKSEEIKRLRIDGVKAITAVFQENCRALEQALNETDAELTEILEADKPPKPEITIISCEVSDQETLQKAVQSLQALGLTVKTKNK